MDIGIGFRFGRFDSTLWLEFENSVRMGGKNKKTYAILVPINHARVEECLLGIGTWILEWTIDDGVRVGTGVEVEHDAVISKSAS